MILNVILIITCQSCGRGGGGVVGRGGVLKSLGEVKHQFHIGRLI